MKKTKLNKEDEKAQDEMANLLRQIEHTKGGVYIPLEVETLLLKRQAIKNTWRRDTRYWTPPAPMGPHKPLAFGEGDAP